jgi:hypothetical protein
MAIVCWSFAMLIFPKKGKNRLFDVAFSLVCLNDPTVRIATVTIFLHSEENPLQNPK